MKSFSEYQPAKEYARHLALLGSSDAGIEKTHEFGREVFSVKFLPRPENCAGHELRMERVRKGD